MLNNKTIRPVILIYAAETTEHYIVLYLVELQSYLAQSEGNALAALERYLQESIIELKRTEFKGGCAG